MARHELPWYARATQFHMRAHTDALLGSGQRPVRVPGRLRAVPLQLWKRLRVLHDHVCVTTSLVAIRFVACHTINHSSPLLGFGFPQQPVPGLV
jgi:hypothetical protein